jgi:predicted XRE-type DNA-binding protein
VLIAHNKLTQTAAAERVGIAAPDLSKLLRGQFQSFSVERLPAAVAAMGTDFEIKLKAPPGAQGGHGTVQADAMI